MTKAHYLSLSIHERINLNYSVYLKSYNMTAHLNNPAYASIIPSNLKHGGWRNTCYDIK